jgi:hypothetical protein
MAKMTTIRARKVLGGLSPQTRVLIVDTALARLRGRRYPMGSRGRYAHSSGLKAACVSLAHWRAAYATARAMMEPWELRTR